MERGYVKYWRSINDNELLENDNTCFVIFGKLLTRVNRHTGMYTTGRNKFASICNMKPATLYSALKRLEASSIIQLQSNKVSTTITICNWHKYQQDVNSTSSVRPLSVSTIQEREREREVSIGREKEEVKKTTKASKPKRDILAILNKVTGRNLRSEFKGIEKTKEMFTDEEIEQALRNMYKDDWHKSRMHELKSNYLLRASTIDNFKDANQEKKKHLLDYKIQGSTAKTAPNTGRVLNRAELLKREYLSRG